MNTLILKPNGIYNTVDLNKSHISLDECEQIVEGTVQSVYTICLHYKEAYEKKYFSPYQ